MAIISKLQLALVGFLLSLFIDPSEAGVKKFFLDLQQGLVKSEWGLTVLFSKLLTQKICTLNLFYKERL